VHNKYKLLNPNPKVSILTTYHITTTTNCSVCLYQLLLRNYSRLSWDPNCVKFGIHNTAQTPSQQSQGMQCNIKQRITQCNKTHRQMHTKPTALLRLLNWSAKSSWLKHCNSNACPEFFLDFGATRIVYLLTYLLTYFLTGLIIETVYFCLTGTDPRKTLHVITHVAQSYWIWCENNGHRTCLSTEDGNRIKT